jgi:hypothetical protein
MSKKEMRTRLAALTFTEKIKILERLRDRSLAFAASGMRRKTTGSPAKSENDKQRLRKEER